MVKAKRDGASYGVVIDNGQVTVRADTHKDGAGGATGMRPHELLESALAACVCMSIDMAARRAEMPLPAPTVTVDVERLEDATRFHVDVDFGKVVCENALALVSKAVRESPVARTLGKAVSVRLGGSA